MIERVVSGGQTGVDRGALDAALAAGVEAGGWCPKGRRAEDGTIPDRYPLRETQGTVYLERTRANVRDSDGTLIIADRRALSGGTAATRHLAEDLKKPWLIVVADGSEDLEAVMAWLEDSRIHILNVAGPRESGAPGIQEAANRIIGALLRALPRGRRAG